MKGTELDWVTISMSKRILPHGVKLLTGTSSELMTWCSRVNCKAVHFILCNNVLQRERLYNAAAVAERMTRWCAAQVLSTDFYICYGLRYRNQLLVLATRLCGVAYNICRNRRTNCTTYRVLVAFPQGQYCTGHYQAIFTADSFISIPDAVCCLCGCCCCSGNGRFMLLIIQIIMLYRRLKNSEDFQTFS